MSRSRFKWLLMLLLVNGVLIEVNAAYKHAIGIPNFVLPSAPEYHLPRAFQHSPLAQVSAIYEADHLLMMSGTVVFDE